MMLRGRKAQMFAVDLLASAVIFSLIVTTAFFAFDAQNKAQFSFSEERFARERTRQLADLMVRTPGHPHNWTNETVEVIGFATNTDHVLLNETIQKLNSSTSNVAYDEARDIMDIVRYEFFLNISGDTYTFTYGNGSYEAHAAFIVAERRPVIIKGDELLERGTLQLVVWE